MSTLLRIAKVLDIIGEWSGKIFAWLIIPLVGALVYEVISRRLFHAPTVWAFDITYMLYGSMFMLGAAYTLLQKGHIRTDIFYNRFSPRWQGIIDGTLYLLFFFPGLVFLLLAGWDEAWHSWLLREKSDASPWRPPIYPFKMSVPVAAALLLLQGISEFVKSVYAALKGRWP
ncbi:hypothetical protein HRbin23_00188 [bacterium HR23]|nr:hypothetical protein HRbin23_00188 [bacterium HR23]